MNPASLFRTFLLIFALLLGNIAPVRGASVPAGVAEPAAPETPDAPAVFAPYAHWQNSSDAYVAVPHDDGLSPQSGATFEAWIFPSSLSGCRAIFGKDYTQGYWVGLCNGRIRYHSGGAASYQDGVTAILPNVWTHIAVVWDPGLNVRRYFINGEFDYLGAAGSAPAGTRELRIGADYSWDSFAGFIAEARVWNVARDQSDIRRTMHGYLSEKMPGLAAAWPFRIDWTDVIGGRVGEAKGTTKGIYFVGTDAVHPFPLRPRTVEADPLFNSLPDRRDGMASAYIPVRDRLLLLGGNANGLESNRIDAIDGGTGNLTALGSLPVSLRAGAAAYAPETGKVYLFGGVSGGAAQSVIYAVDPLTGATTPLAAALPDAAFGMAAAHHPGLGKIFVLGGESGNGSRLDRVSVFDPATESLTPAHFALPARLSMTAAAYSTATGSIFIFGGIGEGGPLTSAIYEIRPSGDGATGSATAAPVSLAVADGGMAAVEDGQTKLIYLLGGSLNDRVSAFDPVLGQLWRTPGELPGLRYAGVALYSPANRHALLIGGLSGGQGQTNVWKFALGDGPPVKLGHWDFEFASNSVNDISGGWDRVLVGTTGGATMRTEGGVTVYTPGSLGGTNVRLVRYDASIGRPWFVIDKNRIVYDNGGNIRKLWPDSTETDWVSDFTPYGDTPVIATSIDTSTPGGYPSLLWRWGFGSYQFWHASWNGCQSSSGLVDRASNHIWGLVTEHSVCGPRSIGPQPRQPDAGGDVYMQGLVYNSFNGQFSEADYGKICFDGAFVPTGMAFGKNGDFWVAGNTGVCRYPAATVPGTFGVQWKYNVMNLPTGVNPSRPSVDRDGRVWFGVNKDATHSGGLTVFEVLGKDPNRQSVWTTDYTWLNAPIGSRTASGSSDYDSSVGPVFANGERVWSARGSQIFTVAQRWQQLDESNGLRAKTLTGLWTARGRLFVATADELFILQPDGITWENWAIPGVKAVAADKSGQIWLAAADGPRLYTGPGGFVAPPSPTDAPAGPITALAVDAAGRVWLGSAAGVTLYDRGRFVTTIAPPTGGGAVASLLADRDGGLWVGTNAGLNRFSIADAAWQSFTTADGLPSNDIGDVVELPNGWLAIAHAAGVTQYRGGTDFVGYSISGHKLPLTVDDKGRLWAGGSVVDGDAWHSFSWANSGLRSAQVADNAADGADRVWLAHPGGGVSVRGSTLPPLAEQVPLISGITPTSGSAGQDIHILGSGFGTDRSALDVKIGGKPVQVISATDTDVTVRLGADNISGRVSLTKNRKRTTTGSDVFCAVPVVTGVTPSGGTIGVQVGVTGTNFDPGATLSLGGPARQPYIANTRSMTTTIIAGDASGPVKVTNNCGNAHTWKVHFNKIDLTIEQLSLSQGLPDQPLIYARPTLVRSFLRHSPTIRAGEKVEIDSLLVSFTDPRNGAVYERVVNYSGAVPTRLRGYDPSDAFDISGSLNLPNIFPLGGAGFDRGNLQVKVELRRRGLVIAQRSQSLFFERNIPLRVILVPILDKARGDQLGTVLQTMKTNTDRDLDNLRRRILPTGDVEFVWSNEVLVHDEKIDLEDWKELISFAPQLSRARSRWNERTSTDALITFGVVDPNLVEGNADGYGLWPDASEMANTLFLDGLDTLCDIANGVVNTISFGLLGSDEGCHLDIPLYVAWAKGNDGSVANDTNGVNKRAQASYLFAHEMGHALGLVKPWAYNGSLNDNPSHSVNDEIGPKGSTFETSRSCGQSGDAGARFDWSLSFYSQPGVTQPIVNPLTGALLLSQNDGNFWTPRAKAMMSYACAKYNGNSFFEPVDFATLRAHIVAPIESARLGNRGEPQPSLRVKTITGPRLHVSGTVNRATGAGSIDRVELLGESAPPSPGFDSGYWLVQLDGSGKELQRDGIFPLFDLGHKHEVHMPGAPDPAGFYAATLLKADGMASLQLRRDEAVLATFAPGGAMPQVILTSPTGGENLAAGDLTVAWTATDADGDPLEIAVDYSADGGATYTPIGSATGSGPGSLSLPVVLLAGSADARVRVTAGDGFRNGSATSAAFTVASQPPAVFISHPAEGGSFGEAEEIQLAGGGRDNQDGALGDAALSWRSDRDGPLGSGGQLAVYLSVGSHTLTLRGVNSAGQATETSVTVTVAGDYDGDSIPDSAEIAEGLNPLTEADALSDADGDGLSLRTERLWGTQPDDPDSDGDGRPDGEELAAGTNPAAGDAPPAPDKLAVYPPALEFSADLSTDTLPAQQLVQVVSRTPVDFTLSPGVAWLETSTPSGKTPNATSVWVQPAGLTDGVHTGSLTVNSSLGSVSVPVTVTVSNKLNYCDANGDGATNQADVEGVTARQGAQAGQANYHYRYDLNRDGVIDSQDVALVTACVEGAAPSYRLFLPMTTRANAPQPTNLLVYGDGLAGGWANWSWNTTVSFASGAQVKVGSQSIAVTHNSGNGGFSLRTATPLDGSQYSAIRFWIYGNGKPLALYLQSSDDGGVGPFYSFTPPAGVWTQISAPLSALGSPATIARINLQDESGAAQPVYYVDELEVVGK